MKFRIWIAQTGKASDIYFESTDLEETLAEYRRFVNKYSDRDDIQIKLEGRQPNFK